MSSKTKLHSTMAVLLAMLLVIPVFLSADISSGTRGKISPELTAKLTAAQPDEIVSAIVKMRATPNTNKVRGMRAAVFTELRRNSSESQMDLVNYLKSPALSDKVETIRQFWIDNMVLVNATKDVITRIASRPDVLEVFDNYTLTMHPRPADSGSKAEGPDGSSQAAMQPLWDSLDHIGAKQVWTTYGLDGTGVVIGGLDTGVDIAHPDIAGKMVTTNPADPTYPGGWGEFDSNGNFIPGTV
ncbi:MAG: hypothetical protein ACXADB_14210, partial [Candidatus Hermodarchaeia archaeon]